MRYIDLETMYNAYFQDKYTSSRTLGNTFTIFQKRDKTGANKNIGYIPAYIMKNEKMYKDSDIKEYFRNNQQRFNDIQYAKQLMLDLYYLIEHSGVKGKVSKLTRIIGVMPYYFNSKMSLSHEKALKIIETIESKIKSLSFEAIQDLKKSYNEMVA